MLEAFAETTHLSYMGHATPAFLYPMNFIEKDLGDISRTSGF